MAITAIEQCAELGGRDVAVRNKRTMTEQHRPTVAGRIVAGTACCLIGGMLLAACGGASLTALQRANRDLNSGLAAQHRNDLATATIDYQKVLALYPHDLYALYDLGTVEQTLGQNGAAAVDYRDVIARLPYFGEGDAMYNLAIIYSTGDKTQAAALFAQLVNKYPRSAASHFRFGELLLKMGKAKLGDQQINEAIKLDPSLKAEAPPNS